MTQDQFPRFYRPRPYQADLHKMWREKKFGIAVLPRQSGKDVAASMEQISARLLHPKTTGIYIGLNTPSIKRIIWNKTYYDPQAGQMIYALKDNVPAEDVKWGNTRLEANFTNGSNLLMQGYFDPSKGTTGVGESAQDYTITEFALFYRGDPWQVLEPIVTNQNEGYDNRFMAVSTPRGKSENNPLWSFMKSMEHRSDYQLYLRTIDDLNEIMRKHGQPPVKSEEELELSKDSYVRKFGNTRLFEQEYYCSFELMDQAGVYAEAQERILLDGRYKDFNLDSNHPVYVMFDIGSAGKQSDATAWVVFQWFNNTLFLYDCGEGHATPLPEYVDVLQPKHYFNKIAAMIVPWDAEMHNAAIRLTPAAMLRQRFPRVEVLAKSMRVHQGSGNAADEITDIQATRMALYNTIIHATNCKALWEHMSEYKYEFNSKLQEWSNKPVHDKHSHMMDTVRYIVQATRELDLFGGLPSQSDGSSDYSAGAWAGVWG
jgi:hypothetical protein